MTDRKARRIALTLAGFLAGHRNRCDRKPEDEPRPEVKQIVLTAWENHIYCYTMADLAIREAKGVDYLVEYQNNLFGIYEQGGIHIPPGKPSVAQHYVCFGEGDCPTWVYKFYGLYRLPVYRETDQYRLL